MGSATQGLPVAPTDFASSPATAGVYLENLWSADYVDRDSQVTAYVQVFDRLCDAALDAPSTVKMLEEAVGELR